MKSVHRALAGFMTIVLILSAVIAGGSMSGIATTATAGGSSPQLGLLQQESAQVNPQPQVVDVTAPNCGEVSYDGEGSPSDPFLIRSVDQLQCINNDEQDTRRSDRPGLDDNYRLTVDLDAGGTRVWNNGAGFRPIGGFNERFTGTLDGNNHTISGLTIDRGPFELTPARVGLFRFTGSNAEIEDITLRNIDIDAGSNTGGVVANNNGKLTNVSASGSIIGTSDVGGVVGFNSGKVTNVSASGNVTGEVNVGGVVGYNDGEVTNASVNISTDTRVVKGVGVTPGSSDIEGAGGLVGNNDGTISNSRVVGIIITGENEVGGLVGSNFGEIQRSYASTGIDANQRVGGLVGDNGIRGTVSSSYAVSNFADPASVSLLGGLVGGNDGTVFNSYWDEEQSGISFSPGSGSTGLSTADMTGESAAESMNFDFSSSGIWRTQPEEYPKFRWQVTQEFTDSESTGILTGDVVDRTGELIRTDSARVRLLQNGIELRNTTISDGQYNFENLETGEQYRVTATFQGESGSATVEELRAGTNTRDIVIEEIALEDEEEEDGSTIDVTRTVSSNEVAPGEQVTVTTEVTGITERGIINTTYAPPVQSTTTSVSVDGTTVNPFFKSVDQSGSFITVVDVTTAETIIVTEELIVASETNTTHEITGSVESSNQTVEIPQKTVTVTNTSTSPSESVIDEYDADNDGIGKQDTQDAIRDFLISDELSRSELQKVIREFVVG